MKRRNIGRSVLAMVLALSMLGTVVLAKEYDIGEGAITVNVDDQGTHTVEQGAAKDTPADGVVITGSTKDNANRVNITVADGQTAEVTFKDVIIDWTKPNEDYTPVEVYSNGANGTNITLNFEGDNTIKSGAGDESPTISVYSEGSADVTIKGEENAELTTDGGIMTVCEAKGEANSTLIIENLTMHDTAVMHISAAPTGDTTLVLRDAVVDGGFSVVVQQMGASSTGTAALIIEDSTVKIEDAQDIGVGVLNFSTSEDANSEVIIKNSTVEVKGTENICALAAAGFSEKGQTSITLEGCEVLDSNRKIGTIETKFDMWEIYGTTVMEGEDIALSVNIGQPTAQKNIAFAATNGDGSFTIKGARLSHFQNLKVDGKQLSAGDFTLTEADGVLILTFSDSFLAGLAQGVHTAEINFGKGYAIFTITK